MTAAAARRVAATVALALAAASVAAAASIDERFLLTADDWLAVTSDGMAPERRPNVYRVNAPTQPRAPAAAARTPSTSKRDPYPSGGLVFYERYFPTTDNSNLYIVWNAQNDERVLVFSNNRVFSSLDGGRSFTDLVETGALQGALDLQEAKYDNAPYKGVNTFGTAPSDSDRVMVFGYGEIGWASMNGGASFTRLPPLPIFPRDEPYGVVVAMVVCSVELWITRDFGQTWIQVATHVTSFTWATWSEAADNAIPIFVQTWLDRSKPQVTVNLNTRAVTVATPASMNLYRYEITSAAITTTSLMATDVQQTVLAGDYLFSVRPSTSPNMAFDLWVSAHGNRFGLATFKTDHKIGQLTIHDVSDGGVILIERPTSIGSSVYAQGTMWVSDGHGLVYSQALAGIVYLSVWVHRYAMHKVASMEATHVSTVVSNGKLKSLITWDKGALWNAVRTQAALDGTFDDSKNPLVLFGATHGSTFGFHRGFYTDVAAPGMILAVGSESITLDQYQRGSTEGDMYFSRNGGLSFRKVINGTSFCRFLDEAAAIVCVPLSLTDSMMYTIDEAKTPFVNVPFSATKLNPQILLSDPRSVGSYLMMAGLDDSNQNFMLVSVDLSPLFPRTCGAVDYELWTPSDGRLDGRCVMGHQITYQRIAAGAKCQSNIDLTVNVVHNCSCALSDFECAYGFMYNADGQTCDAVPTTATATGSVTTDSSSTGSGTLSCKNGYYSQPSGYRLIPGDTCDTTLPGSVDWAAPLLTPCPVDTDLKQLATVLGVSITVLVLVVIGLVVFIWWKRKALYSSYRNLATSDLGGAVRLDDIMVDETEDADEIVADTDMMPSLDAGDATSSQGGKLQI